MISVQVTRGGVVEARHRVHAVAVDADGHVPDSAGDPGLLTYLRSSSKPLQALPLVRSYPDIDERLIAIACASHLSRPDQLDAVRDLLALSRSTESELETGAEPTPIAHNCSGKHAGFLAVCRARDWDLHGYSQLGHPLQQELLVAVGEAAGVRAEEMPIGIDGCGVPTYALTLTESARFFGAIPALEGGDRIVAAMRGYPELLRGPVAADALLIAELPGWIAKGGAEGLFCATSPDGLAVSLKVEDGDFRAILPALGAFLSRLGIDPGGIGATPVENSHGAVVGTIDV